MSSFRATHLVRHDDERYIGRAALVERHRVGDVEARLSVPLANFGQVFALQLEQIERDVGAATFFEANGSRESDEFHLSRQDLHVNIRRLEKN